MEIMILYRNQDIAGIAPVKIEDIRVSPIQRTPVIRERPIMAGADFVRIREGERSVSITFAILERNPILRQQHIGSVTRWAVSDKPAPMALPCHDNRLLDVICAGLPEPSTRQWWESRLTLTFTAFDPYFYEAYERSANCGSAFFVSGDAPPRMRITRTLNASASNQSYSDGADTLTFSTIPAGDMEIDLNAQTAKVGSTSIMQYFTFGSTFIIPKIGASTITGTGTVKWRERWRT